MAVIRLQLEPLTRDAFAPFGDVIEIEGARHFPINGGTIERYHDLANIDIDSEAGGRPIISIMRCNETASLPYRVRVIERHPRGSQAFVPMSPIRMIVVVTSPGDDPDPSSLRAFMSDGTQGVNYRAGVWHMPLISERQDHCYLIVDRAGPGDNCDEYALDAHDIVVDI